MDSKERALFARPWFWGLVYFLSAFALILQGQFLSGIVHAEFGHFPDEPAHAMTAVFFRDYFAAHFPSPMAFARSYYLHYPKIAIGIWPPVFYTLAGFWLLIFGTSHASFLAFMCSAGAALATTLGLWVRRVAGPWLGLAAAALLLCLRPLRFGTTTMMVDTTLTLMCLLAALSLLHYLRTERTRDALLFGCLTAMAMLTKGNALELLLFAPLAILFTGRMRLFLRKDIWLAAIPVLLLGIPWQILSVRLLNNAAIIQTAGESGIGIKATGYLSILYEQLGPIGVAGMVFFALSRMLKPTAEQKLELACAASLSIAVYVFHVFAPVPGPDGRYTMGALPPLIFLFFAGLAMIARRMGGFRAWPVYAAAALLLAAMPSGAWIVTRHDRLGIEEAAGIIHGAPSRVVLVNAESSAEGAFIVSLALLDHRPQHVVVRSSKLLSDNVWTSTQYHPLFTTPQQVLAALASIPVDTVLVDLTKTGWEEDRALLLNALNSDPAAWTLTCDLPVSPERSHHLQIFTSRAPKNSSVTEAELTSHLDAVLAKAHNPIH